jgi:hypothetical protein
MNLKINFVQLGLNEGDTIKSSSVQIFYTEFMHKMVWLDAIELRGVE